MSHEEIGNAFTQIVNRTHDFNHMMSLDVAKAVKVLSREFGSTIETAYIAFAGSENDKARGLVFMYYVQGLWDAWRLTPQGQQFNEAHTIF